MVTAAPEPRISPPQSVGEQRVILHGVTWDGYLQILNALPNRRGSRLTYDDGLLEITVPLEEHEFCASSIAYFIVTLVELMGLKIKSMGSTTMNYPEMNQGAEPDKAFYIQNHGQVAGRNVDLAQDPPPDLVVEVDITHTDILKNQFYARLGVPEFWRFDGAALRIYLLQESVYVEVEQSPTFPHIPKQWLYDFLLEAKNDEIGAMQTLRSRFRSELN